MPATTRSLHSGISEDKLKAICSDHTFLDRLLEIEKAQSNTSLSKSDQDEPPSSIQSTATDQRSTKQLRRMTSEEAVDSILAPLQVTTAFSTSQVNMQSNHSVSNASVTETVAVTTEPITRSSSA